MTVEMWVLFDSFVGAPTFFANNGATVENNFQIFASTAAQLIVMDNGINDFFGSTLVTGQWYHVAYVRNGATGSVYLDGNLEGTHAVEFVLAGGDRWSLGQEYDGGAISNFHNGRLDEVRIWNIVRDVGEINATMNNELTGSEPGLMAYYNFNQGIPNGNNPGETTLTDITGNGYDGTLLNFALIPSGVTPPVEPPGESNWVGSSLVFLLVGTIPTVGEWGMIVMSLLFLIAGTIILRKRLKAPAIA